MNMSLMRLEFENTESKSGKRTLLNAKAYKSASGEGFVSMKRVDAFGLTLNTFQKMYSLFHLSLLDRYIYRKLTLAMYI